MGSKSNEQGRAFEYVCLTALFEQIKKIRNAQIDEGGGYQAARRAWEHTDEATRKTLEISALAAVSAIFEMEPLIIEDADDKLTLKIQGDKSGENGDVRDILICRDKISWEIGLSVKHNHFAVKHSRLAAHLDFAKSWFASECSTDYWEDIKPIFDYLECEKAKGTLWRNLVDKEDAVYVPLLRAFIKEVNRCARHDSLVPRKLLEYLLGEFDFYKVIEVDKRQLTQVQAFNLRGTLNKRSKSGKPKVIVPKTSLPARIIQLDFKPESKSTVEMYMDCGWQLSFRIHNASEAVEPSLKFDIQIVGMPTTVLVINCRWK